MNCAICKKEISNEDVLTFSNGEKVCKFCFENFKQLVEKNTIKQETKLKEQLIEKIIDESYQEVLEKIQEFSNEFIDFQEIEENGVFGLAKCTTVLNEDKYIEEYDNIILKYKQRWDINNTIDFSEICFKSKAYQDKMEQMNTKISIAILNDEAFKFLHKKEFESFPEDICYSMMFEQDSDIKNEFSIKLSMLPYVSMVRMIWTFHKAASAEEIFLACLRWGNHNKIKNGFMSHKDKYEAVLNILKEEGPLTPESMQKNLEELFKNLFKGL